MTPHDLCIEARRRGLQIAAAGDKLAIMPRGACPPDFADVLREHKGELLAWFASPPCPGWQSLPPANLPLVPCEPCPTPTERGRVIGFLLRQTGDKPGPLARWLLVRECAYYDGPARKWDCASFSYAVARDAACWQMACDEKELLSRLETFDELSNRNPTP